MKQSTSENIIEYIRKREKSTGKEITDYLGDITDRAVRKQLRTLTEKGILQKVGKPPRVYYLLKEIKQINIGDIQNTTESFSITIHNIDRNIIRTIDKRYLYISPSGKFQEGWIGFIEWCEKTELPIEKTAKSYIEHLKKYDKFKKEGLINGIDKFKETFDIVYLDKIFYLDFYSIERFEKTKLGQILLYAKQGSNKKLILNLINIIKPQILKIIKKYEIDGVIFVPPTVKRDIQLMKELETRINLPIGILHVDKLKTDIIVPQKTLSKLKDRIDNAKNTFAVKGNTTYNNILIIDDAVGSGATLNEIAKQLRTFKIVKKNIIGLGITGSFKGFDVISEI